MSCGSLLSVWVTVSVCLKLSYMKFVQALDWASYIWEGSLQTWPSSPAVRSPGHTPPEEKRTEPTPQCYMSATLHQLPCAAAAKILSHVSTPAGTAAELRRYWRRGSLLRSSFLSWVWRSRLEQSGGSFPQSTHIWGCCRSCLRFSSVQFHLYDPTSQITIGHYSPNNTTLCPQTLNRPRHQMSR